MASENKGRPWAERHAPSTKDDIAPPTIYCINLQSSTARRAGMDARFKLLGLKHEFVNAIRSDSGIIDFYMKSHHKYEETEMVKRTQACGASHFKALRTFLESKETEALICEDDIVFHKDFHALYTKIRTNMPENTPFVAMGYLVEKWEGYVWAGKKKELHNLATIVPERTWGGQLYWISKEYAIRVLEGYDKPWYVLGWLGIGEMYMRDSKGYICHPLLAIEVGVHSDRRTDDARAQEPGKEFPSWFDQWGTANYVHE